MQMVHVKKLLLIVGTMAISGGFGVWQYRASGPHPSTAIAAAHRELESVAQRAGSHVRFLGGDEVIAVTDMDEPGSEPVYRVTGEIEVALVDRPGFVKNAPYECAMRWAGSGRYSVLKTTIDSQESR